MYRGCARENFSFHINFYSNWNVFYDDDFIIQIIKHAMVIEVAFTSPPSLIGVSVIVNLNSFNC